jgi:hypothetical protein
MTTRKRQQQFQIHSDRRHTLFHQKVGNHVSQHLALEGHPLCTEIGGKIEMNDLLLTLIPPRQTENTIRSSKNHTPWREEADDPNQQAVKGREAIAQISQLQVLLLDAS